MRLPFDHKENIQMRKYELMIVFSTEEDKFKAGSEAVRSVLANFGATIDTE